MIEAIETLLTILFSATTLLAGIGFVTFRQPVYAALSFTATILAATGLYILQNAPYLAAATMVIYAGATIIIFLFVLMFAQHSHLQNYERKYSNLGASLLATAALVLLLGYAISTREQIRTGIPLVVSTTMKKQPATAAGNEVAGGANAATTTQAGSTPPNSAPDNTGLRTEPDLSVAALGRVTYTRYLWSIELAGTLLLVAAGGAILIAHREPHAIQSTGVSVQ